MPTLLSSGSVKVCETGTVGDEESPIQLTYSCLKGFNEAIKSCSCKLFNYGCYVCNKLNFLPNFVVKLLEFLNLNNLFLKKDKNILRLKVMQP